MRSVSPRLLLLFLPLLVFAACQADEERLAEHMQRGEGYFEEEKFDEAIIEFKSALQIDPNFADAHWGLARSFMRKKKAKETFWELRETVRLDDANTDAKLQLAQLLIFAGELEDAKGHAEEVIAREPENGDAYVVLGRVLEAMQKSDEALAAFEKAVETDPERWGTVQVLATAHWRRGNLDEAEKWFRRAAEIEGGAASQFNLARFLISLNDESRDAEIEKALRSTLELAGEEERPKAYQVLANFYFLRERPDEAKDLLREAIEKEDQDLDLIYALARFHNALGEVEEADALIERAVAAAPDSARPLLVKSAYLSRKGDREGAIAAAEKALEIEPESRPARLRLTEELIERAVREGDKESIAEARRIVEGVLADEPTHPEALLVKGKVDLFEGKLDDSVGSLRAAIDARPDWAQAHLVLGTVLAAKRDDQGARAELARTLEIDASLIEARKVLCHVHSRLGEHEYAVEECRRYLRERPDELPIRLMVAQSLVRLGKRDEARAELESIPVEERSAEVDYALGRIELGARNFEAGRAHLMRALEEMPQNYDILRSLLQLDQSQGRFEESAERILAAAEAKPDNAKLQQLRGLVQLGKGDPDEAEKSFQRALELDPNDVANHEQLARFYVVNGRLEEAIETYEAAVEKQPDAARIYNFLGMLYEMGGQRERAVDRYEKAISRDPELGVAKNNLAWIYAEGNEKLDRALDLAQEAKALMPDSPHVADTLGWVLFKRGIPSAAITYLREAEAGMEPNTIQMASVRHHLALAYEANEDVDLARTTAERALAAWEEYKTARTEAGVPLSEPPWVPQTRSLLDRLDRAGG